jgi:hypothetical protein
MHLISPKKAKSSRRRGQGRSSDCQRGASAFTLNAHIFGTRANALPKNIAFTPIIRPLLCSFWVKMEKKCSSANFMIHFEWIYENEFFGILDKH